MKSFVFVMFLTIFGFVISMLGLTGIWPDLPLPTWIFPTVTETAVLDTQAGMLDTMIYLTTTFGGTAVNVLLTVLASVLAISILLISLGVPPVFAIGIQGIVTVVYLWDIVNWFFNKRHT